MMQICIPQTSGMNEFLSQISMTNLYFDCKCDNRKHGPFLVYDTENRPLCTVHSKNTTPFWGMLYPSGCKTKMGVVSILVIFPDRPMFSHIIRKVLARAFH